MGYRSDIRIELRTKDFERLVKEYNKQKSENDLKIKDLEKEIEKLPLNKERTLLTTQVNELSMSPLFDIKELDIHKIIKSFVCVRDEWKEEEVTYFGWNGLKWYANYTDVRFIENFVKKCNYYAFIRVGEGLNDIESESHNMEDIWVEKFFPQDEE